jgi:hypothetical protein
LAVVIAMAIALVIGVLGSSAQADDPAPSDDTTTSPDPQPSDPAPSDPAPSDEGVGGKLLAAFGFPVARNDARTIRRGYRTSSNVAANDSCPPNETCVYTFRPGRPSGWRLKISSSGVVTFKVPENATPGRYTVPYKVATTGNAAQFDEANLYVAVTPDSYSPSSGMVFTHPYRKGHRYKIRTRILRSINSAPSGSRIQVASWSFSSTAYHRALNYAKRRGVIVQIVLAQRNKADNSDYRVLVRKFGTTVTPNGTWVKKCTYSCRGIYGTMHSKIFLFSKVYRTSYVMMTGSANLTEFAVTNQWNQMNTTRSNKPVYDEGVRIFNQMVRDRQASQMYVETRFPGLTSYYYPVGSGRPGTDFMLKALAPIECRGATNTPKGRTIVKIAMYAWYQDRGKWLAKRVRQLWEEGCRVQIVYAISSNPVKKILYSPSGRGRIPMRQILLTNTSGTPIYYLHDKWVAIKGRYGKSRRAAVSLQGSFNFSNLGFSSDENFQMLRGVGHFSRFADDFTLLWTDRQARAPSPVSTITNVERTAPASPTLGTGVYAYMEND